jgi:hypothetical protein
VRPRGRPRATLLGAAALAVVCVVVLAAVRDGTTDIVDGALLVAALVVVARTSIRLASDPDRTRR